MPISVIIPTYNRAIYLKEALESVFRQTLPPSEVIVVDDGSSDNTEDVVRSARKPVQFHRQEHRGVAVARNLGLRMAGGDMVAWLDSDDLWEPEFLETGASLLADHPEWGGVYTGIAMIDEKGQPLKRSQRVVPPQELYDRLVEGNFIATPAVLARKMCYDQVGGFDPQFRIGEDYDMWLRLTAKYILAGIGRPLVFVRVHEGNTMSDADALCQARLLLVAKHFGALSSDVREMPESSRRAYGYAYRSIGIVYIQNAAAERGWRYLYDSARMYPPILERLDTYYEIACGDQARGYRGLAHLLDINRSAAGMLQGLDTLFTDAEPPITALRDTAYGNAYLALAMLADQAGDWSAARRYLLHAVRHDRRLGSGLFFRRFVKVLAGKRLINFLQGLGSAARNIRLRTTVIREKG